MTFDIHFQGTEGADAKPITFGFTAAIAVAGPQKMVNRFVKLLLTPKASDPWDPEAGTDYTRLIGSNVTDDQSVLDAVALVLTDCNAQMQALDRTNMPPPDDQFGNAVLTRVVKLDSGSYDVWLRITNATGQGKYLQLPAIGH